jgi:hypothetical protein
MEFQSAAREVLAAEGEGPPTASVPVAPPQTGCCEDHLQDFPAHEANAGRDQACACNIVHITAEVHDGVRFVSKRHNPLRFLAQRDDAGGKVCDFASSPIS